MGFALPTAHLRIARLAEGESPAQAGFQSALGGQLRQFLPPIKRSGNAEPHRFLLCLKSRPARLGRFNFYGADARLIEPPLPVRMDSARRTPDFAFFSAISAGLLLGPAETGHIANTRILNAAHHFRRLGRFYF